MENTAEKIEDVKERVREWSICNQDPRKRKKGWGRGNI